MRYPEAQIKAAILHPELAARSMAVEYFIFGHSQDPEVMPLLIQTLEKYGPASLPYHEFSRLGQTAETLTWALDVLSHPDRVFRHIPLRSLNVLLFDWALAPFSPPAEAIFSATHFEDEMRFEWTHLLEFSQQDPERVWDKLAAIVSYDPTEIARDIILMKAMVRALSWTGRGSARLHERVLAALEEPFAEDQNGVVESIRPYAAELAGCWRLEAAVPSLVRGLVIEDEYLNERCSAALANLGAVSAVEAIAELWPQSSATDPLKCYSREVFEAIHSDRCVEVLRGLVATEPGIDVRQSLACCLTCQFPTSGLDELFTVMHEFSQGHHQFPIQHLDELLYGLLLITDAESPRLAEARTAMEQRRSEEKEYELAQMRRVAEQIRKQRDGAKQRRQRLLPDTVHEAPKPIQQPIQRKQPKVGRNDPCPCGSGKKYKACCLKKASATA